tara:strand:- start:1021 stop:1287 length:267 start_codon:yes stop_codon:yes gene_type:complete
MTVTEIKQAMMKMNQTELSQIMHYANQIKTIAAQATFSVGQKVMVVQKTKQTPGTIVKINSKKAVVNMNYGRHGMTDVQVPFSMLEVA